MKSLKVSVFAVVLAALAIMPLLIRHRAEDQLCVRRESWRQQAGLIADLFAENEQLSNIVAEAKSSQSFSGAEVTELARLRNEIGQRQDTVKEAERLQRETRRIRDGLQELPKEKENDNPTALLANEMAVRLARVKDLKQWLEENPEEKIPELQFLSEGSWIRSADRQRLTDEEFRGWMSSQRANGEARFVSMAFKALKQYAQANTGVFPTDVSQLKPYFESPIDDAILQRYEIVPAKSLIKFLADAGGDWVITQKAPINKKRDSRFAISITDHRGTVQEGRWDPVP